MPDRHAQCFGAFWPDSSAVVLMYSLCSWHAKHAVLVLLHMVRNYVCEILFIGFYWRLFCDRWNIRKDRDSMCSLALWRTDFVTCIQENKRNEEVRKRIQAESRCYYANKKLLSNKLLNYNSKIQIYKTIIRPAVTYGCETWVLTASDENQLYIFERKILRKIYGPT